MAKRLGMGQKKKRPKDLTELERFLQLNRQVGTVPTAEVEVETVRGPGSRRQAVEEQAVDDPWTIHDFIESVGPWGPTPEGGGIKQTPGPGAVTPEITDEEIGLIPGSDYRELGTGVSPDFIPGQYGTGMDEAWVGAAEEEAAQKESARIAAEEKAYAEGRIYGDYSEDIGAKRQRYIDALEEIQTKARRLNMIAGLTGGTSQADSFTQAALARLDKMEEFHDDERLHQIRTGVYYDQNGNWNPPKSKKEAYDRAIQFGASAAEAAHISGGEPEAVAHVNWQYIGKDGEVPFGKVISTRRGEGVGDRPNPDDWVRVAGYQDESYTDATTHTNTLRRQLAAGDIKGAIDSDVLWRMARERRMEEPDARRRATDLMWSLIPPTERAEQLVTVEDWKNNEEEIERTLWQQGIRYIKVGTSDADAVLVALDEPAAIEGEIIEEEPDVPWWRHFSRF